MAWIILASDITDMDTVDAVLLNQIKDNLLASGANAVRSRGDILYGLAANSFYDDTDNAGRLTLRDGQQNDLVAAAISGDLVWRGGVSALDYSAYIVSANAFKAQYLGSRFISKSAGLRFAEIHNSRINSDVLIMGLISADFETMELDGLFSNLFGNVQLYTPGSSIGQSLYSTDSAVLDVYYDPVDELTRWRLPTNTTYRLGLVLVGDGEGEVEVATVDVRNDFVVPDFRVLSDASGRPRLDDSWFLESSDIESVLGDLFSFVGYSGQPTLARPSSVSVIGRATNIDVSWNTISRAGDYEVEWSLDSRFFSSASIRVTSGTTHNITGVDSNLNYYVRVRAIGTGYLPSFWSDTGTAFTSDFLERVTNVVVQPDGFDGITVSFNSVVNAEEYIIQWRADDQSFSSSRQNTRGFIFGNRIRNLEANTRYHVRVRAIATDYTDGEWSFSVSTTTEFGPLDAPVNLMVDPGPTNLDVSWDAVVDAESYEIRWSTSSTFNTMVSSTVVTGTSYDITGLIINTTYYVEIRALADEFLPSDRTRIIGFTAPNVLDAPSVSISDITSTTARLTCSIVVDATEYQVATRQVGGIWSESGWGAHNPNGVVQMGLTSDTRYQSRCRARNDDVTGPWGDVVLFTTLDLSPPVVSVTADDTSLFEGESTIIRWSISGEGLNTIDDPFGGSALSGARSVTRSTAGTEVYTVAADNLAGARTDSTSVRWISPVPPDDPPVVSVSADDTSLFVGESTIIRWSISGEDLNTIEDPFGGSVLSGSQSVSRSTAGTEVYEVAADNLAGASIDSVAVRWSNPPPPGVPVVSVTADDTSLFEDESTTIRWSISGTGITSVSDPFGGSDLSGSQSVSRSTAGTNTYSASATNSAGTGSDSTSVTWRSSVPPAQPPVVSVSADDTSLFVGQSTIIRWSISGEDLNTIDDPFGGSALSGARSVTRSTAGTESYTVAADNLAGARTDSVSVRWSNRPPPPPSAPSVSVTADDTSLFEDESTTIRWSISGTGITSVSDPFGGSALSGSRSVSRSTPGTNTYSASATNSGGTGSDSTSVTWRSPVPPAQKPSVSVSAGSTSLTVGQSTTIRWSISGEGLNTVEDPFGGSSLSGSRSVSRSTPGTEVYSAGADNLAGATFDSVAVTWSSARFSRDKNKSAYQPRATVHVPGLLYGTISAYTIDISDGSRDLVIPEQPYNVVIEVDDTDSTMLFVAWGMPNSDFMMDIGAANYTWEVEYRNAFVNDSASSHSWVSIGSLTVVNTLVPKTMVDLPMGIQDIGKWMEIRVRAVNTNVDVPDVLKYSLWSVSEYIKVD